MDKEPENWVSVDSPQELVCGEVIQVRIAGRRQGPIEGVARLLDPKDQPESLSVPARPLWALVDGRHIEPLAHVGGPWFDQVRDVARALRPRA